MKLLVAILVVVVQVAGPWLCCCTPARLVPKATHRTKPTEAPACSHCKVAPKPSCNWDVKRSCCDSTSKPDPKSSDCCKDCCIAIVVHPAIVSPPVSLQNLSETPGEFLSVAALGLTSLEADRSADGERPPPFLSVETKLFTHHVLRC